MPNLFSQRLFGVEMEMRSGQGYDSDQIAEAISQSILNVPRRHPVHDRLGYGHSNGSRWEVKTDSSCGYEVASPALRMTDDGENAELRAACEGLRDLGVVIDRACGLHVHIDVPDFTWDECRQLVALWARYEPTFYEFCAPSRRQNRYCLPIRRSEWVGPDGNYWPQTQAAIAATTNENFRLAGVRMGRGSLNLGHWWHNHRIEFRLHHGTVSYRKIKQWVRLLLAVVDRVKAVSRLGAPTIGRTIRQPHPELGFDLKYVFQVIGLLPCRWNPQGVPQAEEMLAWFRQRQTMFRRDNEADYQHDPADPQARPAAPARRRRTRSNPV